MTKPLLPRPLGTSNLMVSPLGLGSWQFSKGNGLVGKFWPVLAQEDIVGIVSESLKGGITWFDTAEVYGWGESEKALADALRVLGKQSDDVVIATKWWPMPRFAGSMEKSIQVQMNHLQGFAIDLYQIHQPYSLSSIEGQMKALRNLVKSGKVQHVGVSNFSAKQMKRAFQSAKELGITLISNQVKYSMLDRRIEKNGILETAQELGVSIIAYSPLEQGLLSGKFHEHPDLIRKSSGPRKYQGKFKPAGLQRTQPLIKALEEVASRYEGATPTQVALNWLVTYHGNTVVAIPGASKIHHVSDNTGALRFSLTPDELDYLNRVSHAVSRN